MSAALSHRFASVDRRISGRFTRDGVTSSSDKAMTAFTPNSSAPVVFGSTKTVGRTLASPMDADSLQQFEIYVCQHCEKQFGRLCDLNKHAKSHSRPFKCAFQTCKYYSLGWPTAKELDRHINDKHSPVPQTYPCLFQNCSYTSKRESNCKQHMEKAHDWTYVRSKATGRNVSRRVDSQLASLQAFSSTDPAQTFHPTSNSFKPSPRRAEDFVLYPNAHDHPSSDDGYDDDGPMDDDDRASQDSNVLIPWTSPGTRFRRRETDLQKFTQQFNTPTHDEDVPIDPQLSSMGGSDALSTSNITHSNMQRSPMTDRVMSSSEHVYLGTSCATSSNTQPIPYHSFMLATCIQQRPSGVVATSQHGRSLSSDLRQSPDNPTMGQGVSRMLATMKRKDENDREDEHRPKKLKSSPKTYFRDNQMPDIFVVAHPNIYNRNTKALYQSCETEHKDISTLVRHLGRVPHRLHVAERHIHSFDVEPQELPHSKIGVCRRCWMVFTRRDAFESHISAGCDKVSKGKREKWQILHDSFTPLVADTASPGSRPAHLPASAVPCLPLPTTHENDGRVYGAEVPVDDDDAPLSPPSPTTIDLGPRDATDRARDEEVERLRWENRHLKAFAHVVFKNDGVVDLSSLAHYPALLQRMAAGNEVGSGPNLRLSGRLTFSGHDSSEENRPDPGSLVGQMNSQPTDVDRQGMMDDIQQTLSRTSSGMSSDGRSTIRHVSNSPPQRFEEYTANNPMTPHPRPVNPPEGHQPTSLPDSGYGSDKKRNSVSGPQLTDQGKQANPHTGGSPVSSHQGHILMPEVNAPLEHNDVEEPNQLPEQAVNPPLDPMLPWSSMSPERFTTRDEAEPGLVSNELLEEIALGGYSQHSSSSYQ